MLDKYTILTVILTIIGFGIMIHYQNHQNDDVLWFLFIPLGIMILMRILLHRELKEKDKD
ncbi:MAG: hypothetical protein SLAVMIC_00185 [uncultured marine phage]|uniref:Uncharacterized protein n=1 Tax=uncultured marine phage TaxID=707152 RepID=A0A8D9C8H2_9VIRU|nr:MAG: hypothetical protein SLAVMIC_00185 [uncultured marine phage]